MRRLTRMQGELYINHEEGRVEFFSITGHVPFSIEGLTTPIPPATTIALSVDDGKLTINYDGLSEFHKTHIEPALEVLVKGDGTWLRLRASTGKEALINMETLSIQHYGLIGTAIADWCIDRQREKRG